MPELPDITVYQNAMQAALVGHVLQSVRLGSPFLLRSVQPPLSAVKDKPVLAVRRLGKRLVLALEDDLFLVLHLMIAGRLHWKKAGVALPRKTGLASFDFDHGSLLLTEASSKKRASLYAVAGEEALQNHQPGDLNVLECSFEAFFERLQTRNNTLKRALTDPRRFDGIGNAYSDEILHAAGLSPLQLTQNLDEKAARTLWKASRDTLRFWLEKLLKEASGGFPKKVTAFHKDMSVHGRFKQPCPKCRAPIQRIVQGEREVNYCPKCQTGGKMLADRAWSKLLKKDWPKTVEAWEAIHRDQP